MRDIELDQIQEENSKDGYKDSLIKEEKKCDCKAKILVVDDVPFNIVPIEVILRADFGLEID